MQPNYDPYQYQQYPYQQDPYANVNGNGKDDKNSNGTPQIDPEEQKKKK